MTVRGCTKWVHARPASASRCVGVWFQVGPGADGYGGALMRQITACPIPSAIPCTASGDDGPVIGRYVDDTTPCPAGMGGIPGTWYNAAWGGWFGRPCVQYWTTDEYEHNPQHGLIYAAVGWGGHVDGGYKTRFARANATLIEWYPFSGSWFGGLPKVRGQGYILQRNYLHPRSGQAEMLWRWAAGHLGGVLSYY